MLLGLKRYEMATGRVVFRHARPRVGAFFHTTLVWVEQALPSLVAGTIRESVATVKQFMHRWIARGIVALERALEWVLKTLHYTTHPTGGGGEVSAFLREVAEHKKNILRKQK